jgi:hypothetical protein
LELSWPTSQAVMGPTSSLRTNWKQSTALHSQQDEPKVFDSCSFLVNARRPVSLI